MMPLAFEDLSARLNVVDGDYLSLAEHGSALLPHLKTLIQGPDPKLAARATLLAGSIESYQSVELIRLAAKHTHQMVRLVVPGACSSLKMSGVDEIVGDALQDSDHGVRKMALIALETLPTGLSLYRSRIAEIAGTDPEEYIRELAKRILG
jgi:hypothetical protein